MKIEYAKSQNEFRLSSEIVLLKPIDEVFPFFADAKNLEQLTPTFLRFQIVSPGPIEMKEGTLINYRLSLHGIRFSWQSKITAWDMPRMFVDEQTKGPYRYWIHEHRFEKEGENTRVIDYVRYSVWGGAFIERVFVRKDLELIFKFRNEKMSSLFGS
jgi:ligand-binding SRPBCC domain-containing protein